MWVWDVHGRYWDLDERYGLDRDGEMGVRFSWVNSDS
jgi:hypothetical protein